MNKKYAFLRPMGDLEGIEAFARLLLDQGYSIAADEGVVKYLGARGVEASEFVWKNDLLNFRMPDGLIELVYVTLISLDPKLEKGGAPAPTADGYVKEFDAQSLVLILLAVQRQLTVLVLKRQQEQVIAWLADGKPDPEKFRASLYYSASRAALENQEDNLRLLYQFLPA